MLKPKNVISIRDSARVWGFVVRGLYVTIAWRYCSPALLICLFLFYRGRRDPGRRATKVKLKRQRATMIGLLVIRGASYQLVVVHMFTEGRWSRDSDAKAVLLEHEKKTWNCANEEKAGTAVSHKVWDKNDITMRFFAFLHNSRAYKPRTIK